VAITVNRLRVHPRAWWVERFIVRLDVSDCQVAARIIQAAVITGTPGCFRACELAGMILAGSHSEGDASRRSHLPDRNNDSPTCRSGNPRLIRTF
jgi:hypothetical protein